MQTVSQILYPEPLLPLKLLYSQNYETHISLTHMCSRLFCIARRVITRSMYNRLSTMTLTSIDRICTFAEFLLAGAEDSKLRIMCNGARVLPALPDAIKALESQDDIGCIKKYKEEQLDSTTQIAGQCKHVIGGAGFGFLDQTVEVFFALCRRRRHRKRLPDRRH